MALTPLFTDGCETCSTSYAETGVISTSNLYVEVLLPIDAATLSAQITGSWTATLFFEATINGDDWFAVDMQPLPSGLLISSVTSNGVWRTTAAGYAKFRVRTASITDEASVSLRVTSGSADLPTSTEDTATITWLKSAVTLTGAEDQIMLSADSNRRAVIIYNRGSNDDIRYDLAGQTISVAGDEGLVLLAGGLDTYSGQEAPTGVVTVTGTAGNIVTVYTSQAS